MRGSTAALLLLALTATPPAFADEFEARQALQQQGAQLLREGSYEAVDRVLAALRRPEARTPAGDASLALLYEGVERPGLAPQDPQWLAIEARTGSWLDMHPDAPTAVLFAAAALLAQAEAWRAGREVSVMPAAELQAMRALLERTRSLLDAWPGLRRTAPDWSWLRLRTARLLGEPADARLRLALDGLGATPQAWAVHDAAVAALSRRWGGDAGLQRRYIDAVLRRLDAAQRVEGEARLMTAVLRSAQSLATLQDELRRAGPAGPSCATA